MKKRVLLLAVILVIISLAACGDDGPEIVRIHFENNSDEPVEAINFEPADAETYEPSRRRLAIRSGGTLDTSVKGIIYREILVANEHGELLGYLTDVELVSGAYNLILSGSEGEYELTLEQAIPG